MNIWHKRFIYLQILLLLSTVALQWFFPEQQSVVFVLLSAFFLAEIGVLENQRKENPLAVYYKKSCLMACIDLLSVPVFLLYFVLSGINIWPGDDFHLHWAIWLLIYIAARKLYIIKNYSYEI